MASFSFALSINQPDLPMLIFGDSNQCSNGVGQPSLVSRFPYPTAYKATITDLATSGEGIEHMKARYLALSAGVKASLATGVLVNCIGNYDRIIIQQADSTIVDDYQDLIDTVAAGSPGIKIVAVQVSPCHAADVAAVSAQDAAARLSRQQTLNNAIAGSGLTLTGVHGRVTAHYTELNDGTHSLKAEYDVDLSHMNTLGRTVCANAIYRKLVSLGLP